MKKLLYVALVLLSLAFLFRYAYQLGADQKQEDNSAYYATTAHCVDYNEAKNRTTFRTPKGIEYYYYNDFEYTLDNLDFYLVMNNNHSDYLLDDYIVSITPIPKDRVENSNISE